MAEIKDKIKEIHEWADQLEDATDSLDGESDIDNAEYLLDQIDAASIELRDLITEGK